MLVSIFTACTSTTEYRALDSEGASILIRDRNNVIEDAIKLNADKIYIVKYGREQHYVPLRYAGKDTVIVKTSKSVDNRMTETQMVYKNISLISIQKR